MISRKSRARAEILERAARLIRRTGEEFKEQRELILTGLDYPVIISHFYDDNSLLVTYDTPSPLCVTSSDDDAAPDDAYVCDETAEKVLGLIRQHMILDDIADV